jgi:hypothetical protein
VREVTDGIERCSWWWEGELVNSYEFLIYQDSFLLRVLDLSRLVLINPGLQRFFD